jgi:hypothetical protein
MQQTRGTAVEVDQDRPLQTDCAHDNSKAVELDLLHTNVGT